MASAQQFPFSAQDSDLNHYKEFWFQYMPIDNKNHWPAISNQRQQSTY